ncbi:MAG: endo-1,4-beta-xylanase [Chitinispirillaceae bacterium]|nr:endo-1,4-beta-xylanase [Chitinispirillaceae bacterium]
MIFRKPPQSTEHTIKHFLTPILHPALVGILLVVSMLQAQPAKGAGKFLGNITTRGQVRTDFLKYWNQITGENETKWASVEGTRDKMSWGGTDRIADYARENGIPWKFHCLVWGSQYPNWMNNLSQSEQLTEITEWLDEAAKRYPDVQMIDVVNEGYPSHKPPPFKNALGGDGTTGFDWVIKIFKMARERWPKAVLIYNDYNTIEWNNEVNWMVKLAKVMKEANAPMDAIGVQAHDAAKVATSTVKSNIDKLAATGYPVIVSEYDIGQSDDARQKKIMEEQFAMFWNHPKVIGITYWGYIVGSTWVNGTGLLNTNGTERPALTWLVDFVKKNPDPPNDYPELIAAVAVGTIAHSQEFSVAPTALGSVTRDTRKLIKVFDLRGRITGVYYSNSQTFPVSTMMPSKGSYVVTQDGYNAAVFGSIR